MKRLFRRTSAIAAAALLVSLPAIAVGASPPQATTNPPGPTTNTTAVVNGSVNPEGQATVYSFQYGTDTNYGTQTQTQSAGSGTTTRQVSATLTGLTPGTTFHYRVIATNASGTTAGADQTFKTQGTPPPPSGIAKPTVTTGAAVNITAHSVQLNGVVGSSDPNTRYYFEYGTTSLYGTQTTPQALAHTGPSQPINVKISGLAAGQRYHYRLVAVNSAGTTVGADRSFATKAATRVPATALTLSASSRRVKGGEVVSVRGVLVLPTSLRSKASQACKGRVAVQIKKGAATISLRRLALRSTCTYRGTVRFGASRLKGTHKLRIRARFTGNDLVAPKSSRFVSVSV